MGVGAFPHLPIKMDVCTQMLVFPQVSRACPEFLGRTSARMTPGCPRDIHPENFLFGLLFVPDAFPPLGLICRTSELVSITRHAASLPEGNLSPTRHPPKCTKSQIAEVPSNRCTLTLQSLLFFGFLVFFSFAISLIFLCLFPFLPKDLKGFARREPLFFSVVFLQKTGLESQGKGHFQIARLVI